jgi:CubicO group peptidase (beta-lactamase class C family)
MKQSISLQRILAGFLLFSVLLLGACSQIQESPTDGLPRSTPEAQGVSSAGIREFLNAAAASSTEFHSFMFLRHGKVIAEGWWEPYSPDLRHTLYSTSKSFTSTAVGLAVSEGLLTVEDKVISFFPEQLPDTISPGLKEMSVKNLLTMSAGQDPDPTRIIPSRDTNWIRAFLALPVVDEPGSRFLYNSMATYMLSAIVQKVTGENLIDYLTPRLFEPLGIEGMDWEVDPIGINTGGWGLRLKTADMAKFGQLYLQQGVWNDQQILPAEWIEEATAAQIEQAPEAPPAVTDSSDWLQGYGYQFWRCRHDAFRADGAFGQFIIVMPEKDAVIAITAESPDMQSELNLVWEYLLPAMQEDPLPSDPESASSLKARLSSLALPLPKGIVEPELAAELDGKRYLFDSNPLGIASVEFTFSERSLGLNMEQYGKSHPLSYGKGNWIIQETSRPGPNLLQSALAHTEVLSANVLAGGYAWMNPRTVELVLRYIESPHYEVFTCTFNGEGISLKPRSSMGSYGDVPAIRGTLVK